jgi:hypothetical protein
MYMYIYILGGLFFYISGYTKTSYVIKPSIFVENCDN